eukprot:2749618-Amphidinium_carterae.1
MKALCLVPCLVVFTSLSVASWGVVGELGGTVHTSPWLLPKLATQHPNEPLHGRSWGRMRQRLARTSLKRVWRQAAVANAAVLFSPQSCRPSVLASSAMA